MDPVNSDTLSEDEINSILDQLVAAASEIPLEALATARRHQSQITPSLIKLVEDATHSLREGGLIAGNGHFYATYLLAEFGETAAWPAVREAISLPDEQAFDLYDDAILEHFDVIIASLVGDHIHQIDELIADEQINLHVRWACVDSMIYQIRDGRTTREAVIERLSKSLRRAIDRMDEVAEAMIVRLEGLGAESLLPLIEEAFAKGLVDTDIAELEEIKRNIATTEEKFADKLDDLLQPDELILEFTRWATFQDDVLDDELDDDFGSLPSSDWLEESDYVAENDTTVRNDGVKVGRNDTCPCGSGKKYKKCCGRSLGLDSIV